MTRKETVLKIVMYGALLSFLACSGFLFLQLPLLPDSSPVLPFLGYGISTGVLLLSLCSSLVYWYLGRRYGGHGLLPPRDDTGVTRLRKCCPGQANPGSGSGRDSLVVLLVVVISLLAVVFITSLVLQTRHLSLSLFLAGLLSFSGIWLINICSWGFFLCLYGKWGRPAVSGDDPSPEELRTSWFEAEKKWYNRQSGLPEEYSHSGEELADRGNRYLALYILYTGCVVAVFLYVVWGTGENRTALYWALIGLVIALLPAVYFEDRFVRTARLFMGPEGYFSSGFFYSGRLFSLTRFSGIVFLCLWVTVFLAGNILPGSVLTNYWYVTGIALFSALGITCCAFRLMKHK